MYAGPRIIKTLDSILISVGYIRGGAYYDVEVYTVEVYPTPVLVLKTADGRYAARVEEYRVFGREDFLWHPYAVYISRRHFAVKKIGGKYYVLDLGSSNGTFLNGVDIRGAGLLELNGGDVINVAGVLELAVHLY